MTPELPETPQIGPDPDLEYSSERPFWDYLDLLVFIGMSFPALVVASVLARGVAHVLPVSGAFAALLMQLVWYVLIFGSLWMLLKLRYNRPFWQSLGWRFPFPRAATCLIMGPVLAFAVGLIGHLIHTPEIKLPMFDQMLVDRPTKIVFGLFVVFIGPLCEELAFRGFLMPLLMRSLGVWSGIVATAVLFGALHGYEYEWSWRHMLLISIVGIVLGWVRYRAGSTAASTFMHSTFNLTQLVAYLAQQQA